MGIMQNGKISTMISCFTPFDEHPF